MTELYLHLRTPHGLVLDQPVRAVVAEDLSGFFGIWPGRADLIAALPAGLLTYRDASGEGFVGLSGGILSLRGEVCRVMARDAQMTRDPRPDRWPFARGLSAPSGTDPFAH